jgi:23S rRNA pseudouridine1911/1915/1917 synthase
MACVKSSGHYSPVPTETPELHELTVPDGLAGERLDVALARLLPQYSRARLQRWIDDGRVQAGGEDAAQRRRRVAAGEVLRVQPPGLVVHPGAGNREGTLQNALLAMDPALARVPRAGIVHRLDKDTSGLMVVARTPLAHAALVRALAAREVGREYLALCQGRLTGGGTVDEPIGRHRTQRTRMAVRPDGREAVTHYRIERRLREHTLVRATLETGRTHQIRVHLAHVGHPVVGDPVYGGRRHLPRGASPTVIAALGAFRRQALHATRLVFAHPTTGRELAFEAPLPEDLAALLAVLEDDAR